MADNQTPTKTPFWKKAWFWVLVVLVVAITWGALAANNSSKSTADKDPASTVVTEKSSSKKKVPKSYKEALNRADAYVTNTHPSRKGLYKLLTNKKGEGFSAGAATYAVGHVSADWNRNATIRRPDC